MNVKTEANLFATSDLSLAAAISLFSDLSSIDRTDQQKAIFFFKRDEDLPLLIHLFWTNSLKVDALSYFNQVKALKSRIYGNDA